MLDPVPDGGEWLASRLGRFIPRERVPDTYWIWGWVGPRAGLDAVVKRKIPSPCRDLVNTNYNVLQSFPKYRMSGLKRQWNKTLEKFIYFENTGPTKFLMCSGNLNMAPLVWHDTHKNDIQFISRYWQIFHCNFDNSVRKLIHILRFFLWRAVYFTNPQNGYQGLFPWG
jgi:hypothetical protein